MVTLRHVVLAAALLALVGWAQPGIASDDRGTAVEAKDMVAEAIASFDETGADVTFARINAGDPAFRDRDLYVFVVAEDGEVVAHGADVNRLGLDATTLTDSNDVPYGAMIVNNATESGVWIDYMRLNPADGMVEPKSSWVVRHDGYVFGVGIYAQ